MCYLTHTIELTVTLSSTRILLGDDYCQECSPPPQPPQNTLDYKEKNLEERLIYADCTLQNTEHKLFPIGIRALKLFKDACVRLLGLEKGGVYEEGEEELEAAKDEWRATIRMFAAPSKKRGLGSRRPSRTT